MRARQDNKTKDSASPVCVKSGSKLVSGQCKWVLTSFFYHQSSTFVAFDPNALTEGSAKRFDFFFCTLPPFIIPFAGYTLLLAAICKWKKAIDNQPRYCRERCSNRSDALRTKTGILSPLFFFARHHKHNPGMGWNSRSSGFKCH